MFKWSWDGVVCDTLDTARVLILYLNTVYIYTAFGTELRYELYFKRLVKMIPHTKLQIHMCIYIDRQLDKFIDK